MPLGVSSICFIARTKASDMRLGSMKRRKQYDTERVGYVESWVPGAENGCGRNVIALQNIYHIKK